MRQFTLMQEIIVYFCVCTVLHHIMTGREVFEVALTYGFVFLCEFETLIPQVRVGVGWSTLIYFNCKRTPFVFVTFLKSVSIVLTTSNQQTRI